MTVTVDWYPADEVEDAWDLRHCLYAYLARGGEILYIGKSWGVSVRGRWTRSAKPAFWNALERERHIFDHNAVVGLLELPSQRRLTEQLLADVESLLIYAEQPWGNIQSRRSRIQRPGLTVRSRGDWPGRRAYRDE